ncbi:MAG: tetratricopeptide repeat protein [Candidatus Cloacimonetes bacterium]|nr:tetratricopeptide repeat protein [Candidatus Cloacimonadota bacterium]
MKKSACIWVLIFFFFNFLYPDLASAEAIFIEDFLTNNNNWPIEEDEYAKTSIVNGTFIFEYKMDESGYHVFYPVEIDRGRDFEIAITLYQISGHDDRGYGLIWDIVDDSNYYSFEISDNGYYRVGKAVAGEWIDVIGWTESEYINTFGGKNTLAVAKLGDTYMFFINKNYVNLTDVQPLWGDYLGFDIWLKQKIAIESLEVSYIEEMDVILDEDFSDNSLLWFEGNDNEMYAEVKNGYYYFQHKEEDGSYFVWNHVNLIPENDFEITTTITHTSGVIDYGYGLVWGMSDLENLYTFNISDNGNYRYGKYVNDEWEILIGWTESDLLRSYNGTNTLTVEKNYDTYNFYINNEWVDSYPFEQLFGNGIGYVIYKAQTIMIDDLIIKQDMNETSSIIDQAVALLENISIRYPEYDETYTTLADLYWEDAENAFDIDNVARSMLYLQSAKAEILSDNPRLNELADVLSDAGYFLNTAEGSYFERMDYYEQAFQYFNIVTQIDETLGNQTHLPTDYINLGAASNNLGNYDQAIDYYTKALNLAKEVKSAHEIFAAYDNLGLTSKNDEKYHIAIDYYSLGIQYARKLDDKTEEEFFNYMIAQVYDLDLEDWEKAIDYYKEASEIARERGAMIELQEYLYCIGDCYYALYKDDIADSYYEQADAIIINE